MYGCEEGCLFFPFFLLLLFFAPGLWFPCLKLMLDYLGGVNMDRQ